MLLEIPAGREQVLAAVQFLKGAARDWWESIIGQSLGHELQQFDDVYNALHERFIPRQTASMRMKAWNSLYHRGTVHDYMMAVNDLALAEMPVHFLVFFCSGAGTSAQRSPARDTPEVTQYTGERWVSSLFRGFQRAKGENFSGT